MLLPQVWALLRYWSDYPPIHLAVRSAPWYPKSKLKRARAAEMTDAEVEALTKVLGPVSKMPDDMKEAIRWAESMRKKMSKMGKA